MVCPLLSRKNTTNLFCSLSGVSRAAGARGRSLSACAAANSFDGRYPKLLVDASRV